MMLELANPSELKNDNQISTEIVVHIRNQLGILRYRIHELMELRISRIDYSTESGLPFFRIRMVDTPAGLQLCYRPLTNGMEGSGAYFGTNSDALITHCMSTLLHIHRHNPIAHKFAALKGIDLNGDLPIFKFIN